MPAKKYQVQLSPSVREQLQQQVASGLSRARDLTHARILLLADNSSEHTGWRDQEIVEALQVSLSTIHRVRRRYASDGTQSAVCPKPATGHRPRLLDGEQEAHLIALACGTPPEGHARWTLRLLADRMVALGYTNRVSHETVRQTLKKMNLSPG